MTDATPVRVRPATPEDAPAMARMHARSWPVAYEGLLSDELIASVVARESDRVERWRRRLADASAPGGAFVAERDGRVQGLVFWGPSRDEDATSAIAEIQAIYLDPDAIGRGVGRELFAAAIAVIDARGYAAITLWVLTANSRARRFYESAGWHADGRTMVDRRPEGTLHETRYRVELAPRDP